MSRRINFTKAVASGYGVLVANAFYTLASVPLALSYLSKAEFGLWALVSQLGAYLALIDLGMSGAISRALIDHKDDKYSGSYGTVVKTGALVTGLQGLAVGVLGVGVAPLLGAWMDIPPEMHRAFVVLLAWQCVLLGFSFSTKIFTHLLIAHQRYDVSNYASILGIWIGLAAQWWAFRAGAGLFSLVWASAASAGMVLLVSLLGCLRGAVLPPRGAWGRLSYPVFRELLAFGGDLFLQVLGWQLLAASQVVIISKFLGLEAAGIYAVCSKTFSLAQQAAWRIFDYSVGAFSEMVVRGETARLRARFRDVWVLSGSLSVGLAVITAACNQSFVTLWTHGAVAWSPLNDWLLALSMVAYSVNRVHGGLAWVGKNMRAMRYVFFAEGVAFVVSASLAAPTFGLPGILIASIVCDFAISGSYGLTRSARYLQLARWQETLEWLKPTAVFALIAFPVAVGVWVLSRSLVPAAQLAVNATVLTSLIFGLFWKIGLTQNLRAELGRFWPGRLRVGRV